MAVLGRPLLPVELGRPKRAEQFDSRVDLGVQVGLSKPAESLWVAVGAWLRWLGPGVVRPQLDAVHPPLISTPMYRRRRVVWADPKNLVPATF